MTEKSELNVMIYVEILENQCKKIATEVTHEKECLFSNSVFDDIFCVCEYSKGALQKDKWC